MSKVQRRSVR